MRRFVFSILLLSLFALPLTAATLTKVNVNAPAVNFVFSPTGKIVVSDFSAPIWVSGFLQSRTYKALAGSPAAGLWVYEYRIDLRNVVGITVIQQITSLSLDFGPVIGTLDFNKNGKADQMFVVTTGGLGNVNVFSAVQTGNVIKFTFNPAVAGGSAPGKGDSTFFFGLVSKYAPKKVTATATHNLGGPALSLQAMAPSHP
jgi:hypothetical protein